MRFVRRVPWTGGLVLLAGACGGDPAAGTASGGAGETPSTPEASSGTGWITFRGDAQLTGVARGGLSLPLEPLWTFEVGKAIASSPVVADGRIFFGADDQRLHCLSTGGEELWSFETGDIIEAPPLVVDGIVYAGSADFFFYAVDARTGELRWKYETDEQIVGGANFARTAGGLRVLVGSYDSHLYCFGANGGELLWKYGTDNYVNGTPAVWSGRAVFGGCDSVLHVVDLEDGTGFAKVELGADAHVAASVGISDGRAYFGHYGHEFVSVDLETGEEVWSYKVGDAPFFSSPAIGADRVVFGGRDRNLHCARRDDGTPLWTFATRRKVDGSPVIAGSHVVLGSADGRLYVLDLEDGSEQWSYDIGRAIAASPAVVDGCVYAGATDGVFYAFGSEAKEPGG